MSNSLLLSSQKNLMVNSIQVTLMLFLESMIKSTIFITGTVMKPLLMRSVHLLLSLFNFQVYFHCSLITILKSKDMSLIDSSDTSKRLVFPTCQEVLNLGSIWLKRNHLNQDFFMSKVRDIQEFFKLISRLLASTQVMFLSLIMKTRFISMQENLAMSMKR